MTPPRNRVENAQRIARLFEPHFPVKAMFDECLACQLEMWAQRALGAARMNVTHKVGRTVWRHRPVAARRR